LVAEWYAGRCGMWNRRWTGCWCRASGVQRAALAGVVLYISRSIIERQIGFGGLAGACVVVIERSAGRGDGVRGLSDWVVVGCVVVVVGGGIAMGRVGGFRLSVEDRTCVAVVGVSWVLEGGGGGGTDLSGIGGE